MKYLNLAQRRSARAGVFWGTTDQFGKVTKGFADGAVFNLNLGLPPKR